MNKGSANIRLIVFLSVIFCLSATAVRAQSAQPSVAEVEAVLARAQSFLRKGESAFSSGDMDAARREFDHAIDSILESGLDVRASQALQLGWREIIEKINLYQINALRESRAWKTQDFEGRPEEEIADDITSGIVGEGPLAIEKFQQKFAELHRLFREKFKREFVITGADHGEHNRLYGRGGAVDIRSRDLNYEHIQFIISTGLSLGLRVRDFSTYEKVQAHNRRVYALGRPLDTLASGLHLHIDRMGTSGLNSMISKPAISTRKKNVTVESPKSKRGSKKK
jgi:hypothetical protein